MVSTLCHFHPGRFAVTVRIKSTKMKLFVFFDIAICIGANVINGEKALVPHDGERQLMYKFMDDIFAIKNQMNELQNKVEDQQEEISELKALNKGQNKDSGATYVRWGRTDCPDVTGTVKIYEGYAAGDHYTHGGGGVDLLCLPEQPTWGKYSSSRIGHAYIYGAEYEIFGANSDRLFGKEVGDHNVPCVVCQSVGRLAVLRIPARTDCYSGWTQEYAGYLFAGHHGHAKSTDYTCIDSDAQGVEGKAGNQNGRLLYPVEAGCNAAYGLQCPPYFDGRELACVVCTK